MTCKRAVENPATGDIAGYVADLEPVEASKIIDAADASLPEWAALPPVRRGQILAACAGRLRSESERLAILLTKEQGKPIAESRREIRGASDVFDFFAGLSSSLAGVFRENGNGWAFTTQRPLGVCLAVIPWNMPALIMAWKTAPALLTGNTVVVKPASSCPLTVSEIASLCTAAGLPENVLSVAVGAGPLVGDHLVSHPLVRHVSFTGSCETGKRIRKQIADSGDVGKRLTLELGGSDAMIVCDDADIEKCAKEAVKGRFFNAGQVCISPKRIFVFDAVYDRFLDAVLKQTAKLRVGNGLEEETDIGPICSEKEYLRLRAFLETSERKEKEGSGTEKIVCGEIPTGSGRAGGRFISPVVAVDIKPESPLLTTEIFGPVMALVRAGDLDDAIRKANDTKYGLGASVWTNDLSRIQKAVGGLDAGTVWVNQHAKVLPEMPFGGVKESGFGRENGIQILNDYLETKTVIIRKTD